MVKPSDFKLNSRYASLKNDGGATTTVTFSGSTNIAGNSYALVTSDIVVGSTASINNVQISSSKDSSLRYSTKGISYTRVGTLGLYGIAALATRISATTIRCQAYVPNPYGSTLTTAAGDETFTFYIDTFIPPISS